MRTKKIMNKILKPYRIILKEIFGNYTDVRVSLGKSFCCYCRDMEDLEIEIPFVEDKMGALAFFEKMNRKLKQYNITEKYNSEILSFLHEIGHIMTYNKFNDFVYCRIAPLIPKVQAKFFTNSLIMTKLCYKIYFGLALERKADKWAMTYIKGHQNQVKQWEKMLIKNYQKAFEKIEED